MRFVELAVATGAIAATLLLVPVAAHADGCGGSADIHDRGGEAAASCPGGSGGAGGADLATPVGGGSGSACTPERAADPAWWWVSFDVPDSAFPQRDGGALGEASRLPEGHEFAVYRDCNGQVRGMVFTAPAPEPGGTGDDDGVFVARQEARARVEPSVPVFAVSPEQAVVRFETWLWIDGSYWQPASASSTTPGGVTVSVEAVPVEVTWDLDEGVRVCDGPGVAWSPSAQAAYELQVESVRGTGNPACTFTFVNASSTRDSGVFDASVAVRWEFSWSLGGVDRGVFGSVEVSEAFSLRVGEVQAVITG